jgi:hypothetical protein
VDPQRAGPSDLEGGSCSDRGPAELPTVPYGSGTTPGSTSDSPDGRVWVLEANANPFISYGHDMANAAAKAGMKYEDFIQRIVDAASSRYEPA